MSKKKVIYIISIISLIILFVIIELFRPKPVDWSMSFSAHDKIPYGTYILFQLNNVLFPGKRVHVSFKNIYELMKDTKYKRMNYIMINNTISLDKYDARVLYDFVKNGNDVFVSARFFSGKLAEKFELKTGSSHNPVKKNTLYFLNSRLNQKKEFRFDKNISSYYFTAFIKRSTVLAVDSTGHPTYIRVRLGRGSFFINTTPFVFTNYSLLNYYNYQYAFIALSYLKIRDTIWDEYYKVSRVAISTPLRYVLSQESLTWAYYLSGLSFLLFMIIYARRKQRIIPVMKPPVNDTLSFVTTISRLYYSRSNHKKIAEKLIFYFFDELKCAGYIKHLEDTPDVCEKIASRTNLSENDIQNDLKYINKLQTSKKISDNELLTLEERLHTLTSERKNL